MAGVFDSEFRLSGLSEVTENEGSHQAGKDGEGTASESDSSEERAALACRAKTHYERLLSLGYDEKVAKRMVQAYYSAEAASYRDVIRERDAKGEVPTEDGSTPVLDQKFVAKKGVGLVKFVGNKFVSVEWLGGSRERIALKNFRHAVRNDEFKLIPKVRVAKRAMKPDTV